MKQLSIKEVFKDSVLWKVSFVWFFITAAVTGLVFWLPTIIDNLTVELSNTSVGLLTAIPYLVAIPVMYWWGRHSDRKGERRIHMMTSLSVACSRHDRMRIYVKPLYCYCYAYGRICRFI